MDTVLVRIRRDIPREMHIIEGITFRKEKGWYQVPRSIAEKIKDEPFNDVNPDGRLVFEVVEQATAEAIAEAETRKEDPAGTPKAPEIVFVREAPTKQEKPSNLKRGRPAKNAHVPGSPSFKSKR